MHRLRTTALTNAFIVLPPEYGGPRVTTLRYNHRQIISLDESPQHGDRVINLDGFAIYPGLINAHDHLELNHYPRSKFRDVYPNAHEWGEDFLPVLKKEPYLSLQQLPLNDRCKIGVEKNLRSGVTTVAHHNPLHPVLRQYFPYRSQVPIRVVQRYGWVHSLHFASSQQVVRSYRRTPRNAAWMIHLAEGTDSIAANELRQLDELDCLGANTVLIHGVGLSEDDQDKVLEAGAGLVWCPSSNFFLLGKTADVSKLVRAGRLALGSDSRLTADGDLLDELRAAASTGQLSPLELFRAMTTHAASLLHIAPVGALLPSYVPDYFVVSATTEVRRDPFSALIDIKPAQIVKVIVGGVEMRLS
jgi:cytosine/adenosine deaminase-related metal-dependent hydrolase